VNSNEARQLLQLALDELARARVHLDFSFQQVAGLAADPGRLSAAQLVNVEAFCARFARTVDLLVNKVLRSLDRAELLAQGTLIDVVNRAEKRGFVARAADLREMKDVRNIIAHDYAGTRAAEVFAYCREQKPVLDGICDRVTAYAQSLVTG